MYLHHFGENYAPLSKNAMPPFYKFKTATSTDILKEPAQGSTQQRSGSTTTRHEAADASASRAAPFAHLFTI